jgi:hypothetical protein
MKFNRPPTFSNIQIEASQTLRPIFDQMFLAAEAFFGPGTREYNFVGIQFVENGPYCQFYRQKRDISISLQTDCMTNPSRAKFQLAHETVHVLAPFGHAQANVLEEGLACWFQLQWIRKNSHQFEEPEKWLNLHDERYIAAYRLVEKWIAPDLDSLKRMRVTQPIFRNFDCNLMSLHYPHMPADAIAKILEDFDLSKSSKLINGKWAKNQTSVIYK